MKGFWYWTESPVNANRINNAAWPSSMETNGAGKVRPPLITSVSAQIFSEAPSHSQACATLDANGELVEDDCSALHTAVCMIYPDQPYQYCAADASATTQVSQTLSFHRIELILKTASRLLSGLKMTGDIVTIEVIGDLADYCYMGFGTTNDHTRMYPWAEEDCRRRGG